MGLKQPPKKVFTFSNPWEKNTSTTQELLFAAKFRNQKNSLTSSRNSMSFCAPFLVCPQLLFAQLIPESFLPGRQTALRRRPGSLLCSSGLSKCKKKGLSRFTGRVHGRVVFGGRGGFEWHFYFRVIFFSSAVWVNFAVLDFFFGMGLFFSGCSSQGAPSNTGCVQMMLAPVENSIGFSGVSCRYPSFWGYFFGSQTGFQVVQN